jgi:RNA-directed DNA polymerase
MPSALPWETMSPGRVKGGERAPREPAGRCHALAPLLDVPALTRAYRRARSDAAVGVDGVTKEHDGQDLEANVQALPARLKTKQSRPQPLRRVPIPTAQGQTRPLGMSACEATWVQDAVREVWEAMDEQAFLECSDGFRPGRRAHDAVRPLQRIVDRGAGRGILEADIGSFFDSVERTALKKRREVRGAEGSLWRRSGQCWHVGGRDGDTMVEPEVGTAQGSVRSPGLGNVSGHEGLDRWCETEGKPRLQGQATLRRSGDDFLSGFAREAEAQRVQAVLEKRLGRFGLTLHPDQTRLGPFGRPPPAEQRGKGPAAFAFVGCTFAWARSRQGHWRMGCQTRRASLRRAKQALDDGCRRHRPQPVEAQHAALDRRLRGPCHDCGGSGNFPRLLRLVEATKRAWDTWRCRRSQRTRLHGERLTDLLRQRPLPRPRITVRIWGVSPQVTSAEEPDGGHLLVRIWRGAGMGNLPAYSTTAFSTSRVRPPRAVPPCRPPAGARAGVCLPATPAHPWRTHRPWARRATETILRHASAPAAGGRRPAPQDTDRTGAR